MTSPLITRRRFVGALGALAAFAPRTLFAAPGANNATGQPWLQTHRPTTVWADPEGGRALAPAPQWTYLQVAGAQKGARIPVLDPRLGAQGWIEAATVGPSGAPAQAAKPAPASFDVFWAAPHRPAPLHTEPSADAPTLALMPQFAPLKVDGPGKGGFLPVEEPFTKVRGWIEAEAVGRVGEPSRLTTDRWWGKVVTDEAIARAEPSRRAAEVARYGEGTTLGFSRWVEGEQVTWDDPAWGEVSPGVYVYGRLTRPVAIEMPPAPRVQQVPTGRWIGINRTAQLIVGYENDQPVLWAQTSTGRPGWETALGSFEVQRRVAKETMDSSTLLGRDAERATYKIENVKYTQYFTGDGNAIHENWWKEQDTFGIPSSHGCAGLRPADALAFWEFGAVGMPVLVHA